MRRRSASRLPADTLVAVGVAAAAASVVLAVRTGAAVSILEGAALPAAFLVAGALGARARPEHPGVRLLLVLGTGHLVAIALTGWASLPGPPALRWTAGALGDAAYVAGFVGLEILLACYPDGRPGTRLQRAFTVVVIGVGAAVLGAAVLLSGRLVLAAGIGVSSVPAPRPLPIVDLRVDLLPLLLAGVPGALVVLAVSARRLPEARRRAAGWAVIATAVLAVMIIGSPAADVLVPGAWDWAFPIVTLSVPFLLLAGLVRYRLLEVDLLVVRTLTRAAVVVAVLGLMAWAVAALDSSGAAAIGALLTVAALLAGGRVLAALEGVADRLVTGGRVRRSAVRRELRTLPGDDPAQACRTIAEALDVSWVRVRTDDLESAAGAPSGGPERRIPLVTPTAEVGVLECGPRRGGWRSQDAALLEALAADLALRLRDAVLSRRLQEQVRALETSRARLVQAEDAARRRVERDLHDGAQQQVVALLARLAFAREQVEADAPVAATLATAHELAQRTLADLRLLVSGIAPPLLGSRGLVAAVASRAALLPIEVVLDADPRVAEERFAPEIEGAAFFVVSEALANAMKHSGSDRARVVVTAIEDGLRVAVVDEGDGAADPAGSGLTGLRDRVEGLGGRLHVQAIPGVGTTVSADLPAARVVVDA